ncbi:XkdX family protein [Pseudoflavonifractor phocaeensis]
MTPYELAKLYYPRLWPLERLDKLLELGRITQAEYDEIVGEVACDGRSQ